MVSVASDFIAIDCGTLPSRRSVTASNAVTRGRRSTADSALDIAIAFKPPPLPLAPARVCSGFERRDVGAPLNVGFGFDHCDCLEAGTAELRAASRLERRNDLVGVNAGRVVKLCKRNTWRTRELGTTGGITANALGPRS